MSDTAKSTIYGFGEFRLDEESRRLYERETGELVPLQPKAFELLLFLIKSEGRILTKNEILEAVWADSFVEEANLSQTVFVLRKALNEDRKNPRFIVTVPNRGYRFIGKIGKIAETNELKDAEFQISDSEFQVSESKSKQIERKGQKTNPAKYFLLAIPLILLFGFGIYYFWRDKKPETIGEIKSIAILPFTNIGGKDEEEYLGNGLSEGLISKLSNIKTIIVRPTSPVRKFTDASPDPKKIGSELNVEAIITGRVQRVDENIRVTVQVVRVSDGAILWAETFTDKFTNILAVQDSISEKVTQSLALKLTSDEREQIAKRYTNNAEAYQDYLVGRYFWNKRTGTDLLRAIENFEKATQKDQNFAQAYSGLANCYILLPEYGEATPHEAFPKAKTAVLKALELDEQSAEAHTALAYAQAFYDWNWSGAEQSFKRALELNPNYATAYQWYGEYLLATGHFDESRKNLERAIGIDPDSPIILNTLASFYEYHDDYDKEIELAKKVLEIEPNFAFAYFYIGLGYERKGMDAEAAEALTKSMLLFGEPPECAEEVNEAFKKNGLKGWWRKRLEQIETRPHLKYVQAYAKALVQIRLDDKEGALESLNQSIQRRDRWLVNIKYQPHFTPLHQDPRFQDLLRRMNLL